MKDNTNDKKIKEKNEFDTFGILGFCISVLPPIIVLEILYERDVLPQIIQYIFIGIIIVIGIICSIIGIILSKKRSGTLGFGIIGLVANLVWLCLFIYSYFKGMTLITIIAGIFIFLIDRDKKKK